MDLNRQYSPSYWSKRYPQPLVVENHIKCVTGELNSADEMYYQAKYFLLNCPLTTIKKSLNYMQNQTKDKTYLHSEVSIEVKSKIPHTINVKYGNKETSIMDIYGTTLPVDSPIFIYIHGGYWQSLNKNISSYVVEPFFKAGIKVIVPGYSLAPEAHLKQIIEQIKSMVLHILNEAELSGVRSVWIGGHSAGAHLASSLLDEEWYPNLPCSLQNIFKGLILISGIFDLTPIIQTEYNDALSLTKTEAEELSPIMKKLEWIKQLNSNFIVLLGVGEHDPPKFQEQTLLYKEFLKQHKVRTEYHFVKGLDHFDIVENLKDQNYMLTKRIIQLIKETYHI